MRLQMQRRRRLRLVYSIVHSHEPKHKENHRPSNSQVSRTDAGSKDRASHDSEHDACHMRETRAYGDNADSMCRRQGHRGNLASVAPFAQERENKRLRKHRAKHQAA